MSGLRGMCPYYPYYKPPPCPTALNRHTHTYTRKCQPAYSFSLYDAPRPHYLWFAFVCFLIRSPPPPTSPRLLKQSRGEGHHGHAGVEVKQPFIKGGQGAVLETRIFWRLCCLTQNDMNDDPVPELSPLTHACTPPEINSLIH